MPAAYRVLAHLGHRLPVPASLRASLAARRDAAARWVAWARAERGDGPLVWAHAASVGEQQVLEPVLARLARARPDVRFVLTHTSLSVSPTRLPAAVCHRDVLPWDEPGPVAAVLDALRPAVLLFGRGDLWPGLVTAAAARGIPIAVAGAAVRQGSHRLKPVARHLLRTVYRHVSWLGAVTPGDAGRWRRLGVPGERVVVTGDPRHDRILERVADLRPAQAVRRWAADAPVLVAGSLESTDDRPLAQALACLATDLRVVLVPHDLSEGRLDALRRVLAARGLEAIPWPGPVAGDAIPRGRLILVPVHGMLGDLYLAADIAYLGGGFRQGKLHAVAEPAAVAVPVIVGPRWQGVADVEAMVAAGGAVPATDGRGRTLADILRRLATDREERTRRGLAARSVLTAGASRTTADAVLQLLQV